MKRALFPIICALLLCGGVQAQPRTVRAIEVELGAGVAFGASKLSAAGADKTKLGETGFIEIRYNMKRQPVDIGFRISGMVLGREIPAGYNLCFTSGNFMLTSDYNFRRASNCSFFVGAGVGYASFGHSAQVEAFAPGSYTDNGPQASFCFMPRVGVELWRHLRFTMAYTFEEQANRHMSLTIGVAIGGGRKKGVAPR